MVENFDLIKIPSELRGYLYEIAEHLWSNHAAVMVGSGFSKNAKKIDQTKRDFPAWYELGDVLFGKIYDEQHISKNYMSLLKLAEEVEAAYGRPMLDQILREYIPDKDHEPSQIFYDLLELPWTDVFTTNYDTLLERSTENVITQRYDIVVNQNDLIHASRPRIIKLHGSFPSERPFIVTEEDYRTYPKKFAPFVNTVQQSLLENTLCLIGFSGDDPNFLQWVGWINDNLGRESAGKIYLIGALRLSNAQKKLLESKNIILIDLSLIPEIGREKGKALDFFLTYLYSRRKKAIALSWPFQQKNHFSWSEPIDVTALLIEWDEKKKAFPNWIITPTDERRRLWDFTERYVYYEKIFETLTRKNDVEYVDGLTWRLEKCLCPINKGIATNIKRILEIYDPVNTINLDETAPADHQLLNKKRKGLWTDTALRLLRFYRESNLWTEFEKLVQQLKTITLTFTPDQLARFHFEGAMQALYRLDIEGVLSELQVWPVNEALPYWEAKRAGLLAGLGKYQDAERILSRSIYYVRKRLNLSPVLSDYTWVSQEATIMLLQRSVLQFFKIKKIGSDEYRTNDIDYTDRWSYFAQYKCDPIRELSHFEPFLDQHFDDQKTAFSDFSFNIGEKDILYDRGVIDRESYMGFGLFKLLEEMGFPPSFQNAILSEKAAAGGLKRMVRSNPGWAMTIAIQSGYKDGINAVLNRSFLLKLGREQIDDLIDTYLNNFYQLLPQRTTNRLANNFISNLPEVLSRLAVKSSDKLKIKIFDFLVHVYVHQIQLNAVAKLIRRLINASSIKLQIEMLPRLLDIPILGTDDDYDDLYFPDIFSFLSLNKSKDSQELNVRSQLILDLIADAKFNILKRRSALLRLLTLYDVGLLTEQQEAETFAAVWSVTDPQTGLPVDSKFYYSGLLNLPVPTGINPMSLFKSWILSGSFNIHANKADKKSFDIIGRRNRFAFELRNGSNTFFNDKGVVWSSDELHVIWNKCNIWWNADKVYLTRFKNDADKNGPHSLYSEFQERFTNLNLLISDVFGKQKKLLTSSLLTSIVDVILEMDQYDVPVIRSKAAFQEHFFQDRFEYVQLVDKALVEDKREIYIDAMNSVIIYGETLSLLGEKELISGIIKSVNQPLKWRIAHLLKDCVDVITYFLNNFKEVNFTQWLPLWINFLDYYLNRSNPEVDNGFSIEEKLLWRKINIKLASALNKYLKNSSIELPNTISHWELIVKHEGEFEDLTAQWEY